MEIFPVDCIIATGQFHLSRDRQSRLFNGAEKQWPQGKPIAVGSDPQNALLFCAFTEMFFSRP
jgi:hypothetical protein